MRKSQYQTPNGCQTSRGTTFVNCKPSQPVQLYALLAGLPTALCPGYQFFIFRLFIDHFTCFTSFIFMSHIIRYWLLPFGCIRPSRPIGFVLPLQLLNGFRFERFFKGGFGQSSCSSRPRAQSRNGDFVAGSCDWWLEAERSCTTSKNTEINRTYRTKWNQMESNGIKWNQSITKSLTHGVKCTIATQQVLQYQMLAFQCFSSCIICTKEPNDPPEAAARSDCSTWRKRHFIQRYIFVKLHTGPIPLCPSLSSASPSMFAFSSSGFCRNFRLRFCGFASVQSCCFRSRLPCVIFISFVALQESVERDIATIAAIAAIRVSFTPWRVRLQGLQGRTRSVLRTLRAQRLLHVKSCQRVKAHKVPKDFGSMYPVTRPWFQNSKNSAWQFMATHW